MDHTSLVGRLATYFSSVEYAHVLRLYEATAFLDLAITAAARITGAAHGTSGWDKIEPHVTKILDIIILYLKRHHFPRACFLGQKGKTSEQITTTSPLSGEQAISM